MTNAARGLVVTVCTGQVIHYYGGDDSLLLDQSEARDEIRDALPFAIAEPPADWMVQRRNDATMRHCHATRAVGEADGCVRDDATVCPMSPPAKHMFDAHHTACGDGSHGVKDASIQIMRETGGCLVAN